MLGGDSTSTPTTRHQDKIIVESDLDYRLYLPKLKLEFETRYKSNNNPSPRMGLSGFERLKIIGFGSFGKIQIVKDNAGKLFAVKIMAKCYIAEMNKIENIIEEKRLMNSLRFPYLMCLDWSRKDTQNIYLGMPVLHGGNLFDLIGKFKHFEERHARFYAAQICLALEYLHYLRVIYRDLKLENLLLDRFGNLRLADFGASKIVLDRTLSLCGTPEYMSPELIQAIPYFSGPDWWAYGVLVFEMCSGTTPFYTKGTNLIRMHSNITQGKYVMPARFSESLKRLVKDLLVVDITNRLGCRHDGAEEVKQHPWFEGVNWPLYLRKEVPPPFNPGVHDETDLHHFKDVRPQKYTADTRASYSAEFQEF